MITFIAFILTMLGSINWLLIGLLQYDFIAGLFGFQASIFSRIFYIIFGAASVYLAIRVIANKGTFKVFERKKKKDKEEKKQETQSPAPAYANIEASREPMPHQETSQNENHQESGNGLFDEHMKKY